MWWRSAAQAVLALRSSAAGAALVAALVACAGSHAPRFDGEVFRHGKVAFRLDPPPASWRRVDVSHASLAYRDEPNDGSVLVNARCLAADERTPLVALTNHLLIGATERNYLLQEATPFDAREALHTRVEAKWDGVPMVLDVWVLSKDGCVYDFVYMAPPARFGAGAPAFERFVRGFRTLPGSGVV